MSKAEALSELPGGSTPRLWWIVMAAIAVHLAFALFFHRPGHMTGDASANHVMALGAAG